MIIPWLVAAVALLGFALLGAAACGGGDERDGSGSVQADVEIPVDEKGGPVGSAWITVRAFQSAFQPISPPQKLSDETLMAPAAGESFYQAYVRIQNNGSVPLRVDPEDFVCRIGNVVATLEPTRSGPMPRSLIGGTSLDLVVTFRGRAGEEPVLIYTPPWYDGLIYISTAFEGGSATTTIPVTETESSTTSSVFGQ